MYTYMYEMTMVKFHSLVFGKTIVLRPGVGRPPNGGVSLSGAVLPPETPGRHIHGGNTPQE